MGNFFVGLSAVIVLSFLLAYAINKFKQPLLIGYILAGILAGPVFLNLVGHGGGYESFAHMGIAFLLFIVGLHLNFRLIEEVGKTAVFGGFLQIGLTTVIGGLIAKLIGFSWFTSLIIGFALSFSSTIIIVKVLSDKKDLEKLYGRISLGFLLVQDIVAVMLLMILGAVKSSVGGNLVTTLIQTALLGTISIVVLYFFNKHIIPKLVSDIAKSTELLFVFILGWCFGIATLFSEVGLSMEIGALLAGVALASSPYQHEISSRIKPLRDFFIIMFFIFLGSEMIPTTPGFTELTFLNRLPIVWDMLAPILGKILILTAFVLIGKIVIIHLILSFMGYTGRVGFSTGVAMSQISEFSIIIALLAKESNVLSSSDVSVITFVALLSITFSAYLMKYSDKMYFKFQNIINKFEKKNARGTEKGVQGKRHAILLFGMNRIGFNLIKALKKQRRKYLVVDYNPETIEKLKKQKIPCVYGDASNIEFLSEFNFKKADLVISTISDYEVNSLILANAKDANPKSTVLLTADTVNEALDFYEKDSDFVILPHFLGGHYASTLIQDYKKNPEKFIEEKIRHLDELKERKEFGHEHPLG